MNDIQNGFYRISIKALILDEDKKFLLMLEENGMWELPGGGLDFGETPHNCLIRELKEEAGLEVISSKKQPSYFVTGINYKGQPKALVLYEVKVKNLNFKPSEECVNLMFFDLKDALKVKLYPTVEKFIKVFNPDSHKK